MPLPLSGPIYSSNVNVELGRSSTTQIYLNDAGVRSLFGKSSGAIYMSDGYGKSNLFFATINSNQQQLNLRTWALANGWNGTTGIQVTVASGVYIWSDNTSIAGLTIDGSWPGGITLVNNGFIIGKGGNGGSAGVFNDPYTLVGTTSATSGGPAISLGTNVIINNNSYIAGGGGGGARGAAVVGQVNGSSGGGGAGGGTGGTSGTRYTPSAGGAGGAIGQRGANAGGSGGGGAGGGAGGGGGGRNAYAYRWGGGGGGRILPGTGGNGFVGPPGTTTYNYVQGGAGGSANNAGTSRPSNSSGGGGGWGASGGSTPSSLPGSGGRAIALNGFSVSFITNGNVYGAVS
jgi:hypothetical protein